MIHDALTAAFHSTFALATALLSFARVPIAPGGADLLRFKGEDLSVAELPPDFPEEARAAAEYWAPWAEEHDYRMSFTDDGRVVVLDREKKLSAKDWKLVVDTLSACDALMPLPERPEKPEPTEASAGEGTIWSFGDVVELEHETAAFFRMREKEDFSSMLAYVAEREGKDSFWVSRMEDHTGLLMYRPLAGAVVEAAAQEEWDAQNEMVNRIARLLVVRRFGRAPHWLSMGSAWHVEFQLRKSIYCYPFRDSFVGVGEHGGWRNNLESQFRSKQAVLDFNRLASWQVGTYDDLQAGRAWGAVGFMQAKEPGVLGLVLEDLRLLIEERGRVDHADGTWELIPDFEPSPEDQLAVLEKRVDPEFIEELVEFFRKGMRPPKDR